MGILSPILQTISNNHGSVAMACVLPGSLSNTKKPASPSTNLHEVAILESSVAFLLFTGMTSQEPWECGFRCFRFQLAGSFSFRNLGLVTGPVGAFCRVKTGIGCPFSAAMRIASTSPVRWEVRDVRNGRLAIASINDYSILQSSTCIHWHRELSWRMQGWTTR